MDVPLVNLGNQRERRQRRPNPNVQNDKTAPAPTPAPDMAIVLMMMAQVMKGQQAMILEQIQIQTERQPETGPGMILKGLRRCTCQHSMEAQTLNKRRNVLVN